MFIIPLIKLYHTFKIKEYRFSTLISINNSSYSSTEYLLIILLFLLPIQLPNPAGLFTDCLPDILWFQYLHPFAIIQNIMITPSATWTYLINDFGEHLKWFILMLYNSETPCFKGLFNLLR